MEWVLCDERLPKDHELVCATVKWDDDETIELAVGYRLGDWHLMDSIGGTFNYGYTVLAWMPLPKSYTADRKTENSSEIPNNSTISKMEQVDKDINVRSKDEPQKDCFLCKWLGDVDVCGRCRNRNLFAEADTEPKPKDEPQTCDHRCVQTEVGCERTDCAWR